METRILVLGGVGRMGSIIAQELTKDYLVTAADLTVPRLATLMNTDVSYRFMDIEDRNSLEDLIGQHDLVIGCLPANLGFRVAFECARMGKNLVDLSYMPEDPFVLDSLAKEKGATIAVDTGLAPGLTNLIAGRVLAKQGYITSGKLMVGGMAADPGVPYGYRTTWSPKDLLAEYTRPARCIAYRNTLTLPALSSLENILVPGVGTLEAFVTDGLRTLLQLKDTYFLIEKTLRWPGHVEAVSSLIKDGTFISEIEEQCSTGDDLVVLRCEVDGHAFTMVERNKDGLTAMQRTTALTCTAFIRLVAECGSLPSGILTPEEIGKDEGLYNFIIERLGEFDIKIEEQWK